MAADDILFWITTGTVCVVVVVLALVVLLATVDDRSTGPQDKPGGPRHG